MNRRKFLAAAVAAGPVLVDLLTSRLSAADTARASAPKTKGARQVLLQRVVPGKDFLENVEWEEQRVGDRIVCRWANGAIESWRVVGPPFVNRNRVPAVEVEDVRKYGQFDANTPLIVAPSLDSVCGLVTAPGEREARFVWRRGGPDGPIGFPPSGPWPALFAPTDVCGRPV